MLIESPSNPRIKAALALRERRERDATGLTLVDGAREARRALESGTSLQSAFVCSALLDGDDARQAVDLSGDRVIEVSERVFTKLAYGDRADGVVLVVRPSVRVLADLELEAEPLVVVTEDVSKPGNVGAILRTADGVGADAVVAVGGTDLFNPNVIRASVGTVFSVPVAAASAEAVRGWLGERGIRAVATRVSASRLHVEANLRGPLAVVLGSEAEGLSEAWRDVEAVRLPMAGRADSLNVSAAAAVVLYEAWRQRHADPAPGPQSDR